MQERIDDVLANGVASGAAPGVVAVAVDRDGTTYEGAFGERSIGSGTEMTVDTVGAIFSMTKAITGAAAMQLVEQEKLDLDADAGQVLDDLANPVVLTGFDDDGQPLTRPATGPVTLRHLLTHTSGHVYDMWNADIVRWHRATGIPNVLSLQRAALRTPLMFDPGSAWEYGIGIDWAGLMVEALSGQTLGEYLAEHLTGPLGMHDTAFAHTPSMLERAATVHARMPDSSFAPIELKAPEDPEFEMGGGGLQSTMVDYARFIRMILNGGELDGERVLRADTVAQMATNNMGDLRVKELVTVNPQLSNDAELYPGEAKSWGLTFQVHEEASSVGHPAGTLTWAGLANSYFWIDPVNGVGGCYLSQILPFADAGTVGLFYDFERSIYDN